MNHLQVVPREAFGHSKMHAKCDPHWLGPVHSCQSGSPSHTKQFILEFSPQKSFIFLTSLSHLRISSRWYGFLFHLNFQGALQG